MNTLLTHKITAFIGTLALIVAPLATPLAVNAAQTNISILDGSFATPTLTIPVGTTLVWTNNGNTQHTVTATNNMFDSGTLNPGNTFSYTFNTVGTFNYYCRFHNGMTGVIIVTNDASQYNSTYLTNSNTLYGNVTNSNNGSGITYTIIPVKTTAISDGTFENGWKYILDITAPLNEQNLMLRFDNWININNNGTIPAASNMRFYSIQSSNANTQGSAIYINSANTYSASMFLNGNLGSSSGMRHFQVTIETRVPIATPNGPYTTNFAIRTQ